MVKRSIANIAVCPQGVKGERAAAWPDRRGRTWISSSRFISVSVNARFKAIEWDFLGMDPRMANQVSGVDASYRGGNASYEIQMGTSSDCLLRLSLTVDW